MSLHVWWRLTINAKWTGTSTESSFWFEPFDCVWKKCVLLLTGFEGCRDARSHHRSKQHVESQHILCVVGHVLQMVLCGAAIQSQLPGTVTASELWDKMHQDSQSGFNLFSCSFIFLKVERLLCCNVSSVLSRTKKNHLRWVPRPVGIL